MLSLSRTVVRLTTALSLAGLAAAVDPAAAIDPNRNLSVPPNSFQNGSQGTIAPYGNNYPSYQQPGANWQPGTLAPPIAGAGGQRFDGQPVRRPAFDGRGNSGGGQIYNVGATPSRPAVDPRLQAGSTIPTGTPDFHPVLDQSETELRPRQTANRWRLGVFTTDTPSGVVIRKPPLRNTPAYDIGLEQNDRIVAVNGYRVGTVHGVKYDLGREFNERANEDGLVHLLVQSSRPEDGGRLMEVDVNLEPTLSQVSGSLVWNERLALPPTAYAKVQLQSQFRPGAPTTVVKEVDVPNIRGNEAPFVIEFDRGEIDQTSQYMIAAFITDGHRTYYHHTQPVPVITGGAKRRVEVAMRPTFDPTGQNQYEQVGEYERFRQLFAKYMGRELRPGEEYVYQTQFDRGASLNDAVVDVVSAPEYYNAKCDADDRKFIENVFELRNGRKPTSQEMGFWLAKLQESQGLRKNVSRELIGTLN